MICAKLSNPAELPFWAFPKGHPDAGETDVEGAAREVLEEIGIDVRGAILPAVFTETSYTYAGRLHKDAWQRHPAYPDEAKRPATVFFKIVRLFLAVVDEPPPLKAQEEEVACAEWVPLQQIEARLHRQDMRDEYLPFLASQAVREALG